MNYSNYDNVGVFLDNKLDELFKKKENGFFIELGAFDGLIQSNTAFFEKTRNWKGILIEPSFKRYEECKINRPNSICFNYACVSNDYNEDFAYGDFEGYTMSSIDGKRLIEQNVIKNIVKVNAITLENILNKFGDNNNIDFLSLDTEGYELNVLKGLNLNKYRPNYMLIEIYTEDYENIITFLKENNYSLHSNFTNYNKITNPGWDGTHNDYLFIDNKLL